jgi:hypothetical protein
MADLERSIIVDAPVEKVFSYIIDPLNEKDSVTSMNLVIDYTIPIPVFGKIREWLLLRENKRRADIGIANIKTKLEG